MRLRDVFAHAIVRRLAYVLVALVLAWCGVGKAHAATQCPNAQPYVCDQGQAYVDAMRQAAERAAVQCNGVGTTTTRSEIQAFDNGVSSIGGQLRCLNTNGSWGAWGSVGIEAAFYGGKCTARPTDYGGYFQSTIGAKCHEGCSYTLTGITQTETVTDRLGKSYTYNRGNWAPSGAVCGASEGERPPSNSDYCQAVEGGHKVCSNANGQKCVVSGKTGRSYCWTSSESGAATAPTRDESFSKSAPGQPAVAPIPRTDEAWSKTSDTSVTNNTTNTTVNVAGYNNSGMPNTGTESAVPGDGSDNPGSGGGSGDGSEEGEGNGASGGGSCSQPPATTGDPLLGMIATQTWKVRCAVLGNGISASGDIEDCSQPYSVQATDPDVVKDVQILRGLRAINCPDETPPTDAEYIGEEGSKDGLFQGESENPPGSDGLDESGFGYGTTCPAIPTATVYGYTIAFDEAGHFCDWFVLGGWFVIAVLGFLILRSLWSTA